MHTTLCVLDVANQHSVAKLSAIGASLATHIPPLRLTHASPLSMAQLFVPPVQGRYGTGEQDLGWSEQDVEEEHDSADATPSSTVANPGDFSHAEDDKSMQIHAGDGLSLTVQNSVLPHGVGESASIGMQMGITSTGAHAVLIISDQQSPSLQAVVQPGPEGKVIRLTSGIKPRPGMQLDVETSLSSGGPMGAKVTAKAAVADFHTSLTVEPALPLSRGGGQAEFTYHQAITPSITAGGSLQASLAGTWTPVPAVQNLRDS